MAKHKLIKSEDHITTEWSGGTTTELYIHPEGSKYADRNFDFRISSAVVQCEKSEFTPLPSVHRYLMILDGEISVQHENHHSAVLGKFDSDEFSGDWNTVSFGQATDFNLMCMNDVRGSLVAHSFQGARDLILPENCCFIGFYLYTGSADIRFESESLSLRKGDFLMLSDLSEIQNLQISTSESIELIEVQVF